MQSRARDVKPTARGIDSVSADVVADPSTASHGRSASEGRRRCGSRSTVDRFRSEAAPGESLLDLLRERFGLRSMKDGCAPEGSCGACTVMVDGRAVVSCAQAADRVEGKDVLTLEGLPEDVREAWADAFVAAGSLPVRLLHAGHRHEGRGVPAAPRGPRPRGDRPRPGGQPLPLHRVCQDHRCDRGSRGRQAWRCGIAPAGVAFRSRACRGGCRAGRSASASVPALHDTRGGSSCSARSASSAT